LSAQNLPDIIRDQLPKPDKGVLKWVNKILGDPDRISRYIVEAAGAYDELLPVLNSYEDAIDLDLVPKHWVPVAVDATLKWLHLVEYWILRYTGLYNSDEPFQYIFRVGNDPGVEVDPDLIRMFVDDAERNQFQERQWQPFLDSRERARALPFVRKEFGYWDRRGSNVEGTDFMPSDDFLELAIWAVFVWVMSPHGRDWIYMKDQVYSYAIEHGVAYQSTISEGGQAGGLIDHNNVYRTGRPTHTCADCDTERLWCTRSISTTIETEDRGGRLVLCQNCIAMRFIDGLPVNRKDPRVLKPSCPHISAGEHVGTCVQTCPHSGMTEELAWEILEEAGDRRAEAYSSSVDAQERPELGWRDLDELVDHFD
jgi:hypothetical protein